MTFFFLYFETANKISTNYSAFSEVGKFNIPDEIYAGKTQVIFSDKKYSAHIISDETKQSANNFFQKGSDRIKSLLFDFIRDRIQNECIIANLAGYIETNDDIIPVIKSIKHIKYEYLKECLIRMNFHYSGISVNK
jgi:hypothetical protein